MYFWIDPGEHTGWVNFNEKGEVIETGTCNTPTEFYDFLANYNTSNLRVMGYEEFRLYPWKSQAQMWNEFHTCQVIGAYKYVHRQMCTPPFQLNIQLVAQPANIMSMGYMYAGMNPPSDSNPLRHQLSAFAHGVYWLQTHGIRRPQQGRIK